MTLDSIPRVHLAQLPTALEEAPRLAKVAHLRKLLIKRDDNTGLAIGGNKARKLEFLMAEALTENADIVITAGGLQSNHARMTAAAARKLGMGAIIYASGLHPQMTYNTSGGPRQIDEHIEKPPLQGNLLLEVILGAKIRFVGDVTVERMEQEMSKEAELLARSGRRPYVIPVGGSTPIGVLGYVLAMRELAEQLKPEDRNCQIVFALGSGGTMAGSLLGARLFLPEARIIAVSVRRRMHEVYPKVARLATEAASLIGENITFKPQEIEVSTDYIGRKYGVPSEAGIKAILLAARTEGLILDPVYTGKAMAGLLGMAKKGELDRERTTVFIHTGGAAGLFAFEECFRDLAKL